MPASKPVASSLSPSLKLLWAVFPAALLGFHFTAGRSLSQTDRATKFLCEGHQALAREDWPAAASAFSVAVQTAPPSQRSLQMAGAAGRAKALIRMGELFEAIDLITPLLLSQREASDVPARLLKDLRAVAGEARFYAAYALKLENAPHEMWTDELDLARQQFRVLAELSQQTPGSDPSPPTAALENLEETLRLERCSNYELAAKPVPMPCQNARKKGIFQKKCDRCGQKPKEDERKDPKQKSGTREKFKLESGS